MEQEKKYITLREMASRWEISPRRVQVLCADGRIEGAIRLGRDWMIPENAPKPLDGRTKTARALRDNEVAVDLPMPRKTPFLYMTDLYNTPGTADIVARTLVDHHEAQVLFEAEVAYSRGDIDMVYDRANYLLNKHSGFYAILSAGMLLALCAIWRSDLNMWRQAKLHIAQAPAKNDTDRDIMHFSITAVDSMLYDVMSFPEWFKAGCFEPLPADSLPAANVFYAKFLYAVAYAVATREFQQPGVSGLSLMSMLPATVEPLICWVSAQRIIVAEMYLRLTCATICHNCGKDARAVEHLDRAIALALPDRFYGLLAEYCRPLDTLMEQRLNAVDPSAWQEVYRLHRMYYAGWAKLSGSVRGKTIVTTLTPREREVAKLAAFGMQNSEISDKLHMSLSGVKQAIRIVSDKTGVGREEFAAFL